MRASNVVVLVLTVFAATPALAAPLSGPTSAGDSVEIQVPSNIETRNPQTDSLVTARAGDGDAALNEIFARNIPALKNKREKTGPLPQSLSSRDQHLQARVSLSSLKTFVWLYRLAKGSGLFKFGRREVTPGQLAARITPDELVTESREIDLQDDIQARSIPKVLSETVARDDAADDFITSLLQSRDSEITLENIYALASRVFNDLD